MMSGQLQKICLVWPYLGLQYYDRYLSVKKELRGIAEVVVLALSDRSASYPFWKDTYPEVEYCFHDKEWESMEPLLLFNAIYTRLAQIKPTAVFSHSYSTIDARSCIAYCSSEDVRLCIMTDSKADDFKRVWWKEYIKQAMIKGADGMLVCNKSNMDYYRHLGFKGPMYIGYNSMSGSTVLDRVCRQKVHEIQQKFGPFLICIARPIPRKCVPELVAVWQQAVKGTTRLLVIGGDQDQYGITESSDGILFVGQVAQEESYNYIAASCGLVLPSSEDQWGNVVNEALILGKRVIVSEGCGSSSIITEKSYGYTFKKNDWEGLRTALDVFINEKDLCPDSVPILIRIESFVLAVQTFLIDSYKSPGIYKLFARLLVRLTMVIYPHKTYL